MVYIPFHYSCRLSVQLSIPQLIGGCLFSLLCKPNRNCTQIIGQNTLERCRFRTKHKHTQVFHCKTQTIPSHLIRIVCHLCAFLNLHQLYSRLSIYLLMLLAHIHRDAKWKKSKTNREPSSLAICVCFLFLICLFCCSLK